MGQSPVYRTPACDIGGYSLPTVSITSPAADASISGMIVVSASAADNIGVTRVEFYLDGALLASDTTTP